MAVREVQSLTRDERRETREIEIGFGEVVRWKIRSNSQSR